MTDAPLVELLISLADDEFILGHRDAEWTGHAPILEEDIAFSNIAQDEIGHSLLWYTLLQSLNGKSPDAMGFSRAWTDFRCCRFVAYRNGDFGHAVVRQYLFDEAERIRLTALRDSTHRPIAEAAGKMLPEESYHLRHTKALVLRLGDATEESHRRMQAAVDLCFPQALGMFEELENEDRLVSARVFSGNASVRTLWLETVVPVLRSVSLTPAVNADGSPSCDADTGGRSGKHTPDLESAVRDIQSVYQTDPEVSW